MTDFHGKLTGILIVVQEQCAEFGEDFSVCLFSGQAAE